MTPPSRGSAFRHRAEVKAFFLPESCTRTAPFDCKVTFREDMMSRARIVTHFFDDQTIAIKAWPIVSEVVLKDFGQEALEWLREVHSAFYNERILAPLDEPEDASTRFGTTLKAESGYAARTERIAHAERLRTQYIAGTISRETLMRELDLFPDLQYNAALDMWVEDRTGGSTQRPVGKLAKPSRLKRGDVEGSTPSGPTKYVRYGVFLAQDESCNLSYGHNGEHEHRSSNSNDFDHLGGLITSFHNGSEVTWR